MINDSDPRSALGPDEVSDNPRWKRATRAGSSGQPRRKQRKPDWPDSPHTVAAVNASRAETQPLRSVKPDALHYRLADLFTGQPWVHTYRGDTQPLPTVTVDTGRALTASILRDRMAAEDRFTDKAEEWVEEIVEYAMKHFFARVPNEERGNRIVNRFTGADWWGTLIEESIDHYKTVRIPPEAFEAGRKSAEAFYAAWPKKVSVARAKTPREAADRFNQMLADHEARQPTYPDAEPLT